MTGMKICQACIRHHRIVWQNKDPHGQWYCAVCRAMEQRDRLKRYGPELDEYEGGHTAPRSAVDPENEEDLRRAWRTQPLR